MEAPGDGLLCNMSGKKKRSIDRPFLMLVPGQVTFDYSQLSTLFTANPRIIPLNLPKFCKFLCFFALSLPP